MVSGDHVLPTITPHVGGYESDDDPLQRFFASLEKIATHGADVDVVLPAHGHPFGDLAGRAREIVDATLLTYTVKADVGGKIAQLGSRLIDSTARKLAGQFFTNLGSQLSDQTASA